MAVKIYLPFCLFVFLLAGCALIPGYERIAPLVELGDSRSGIDSRMKEEEQLFLKLEKDARDNRLKKGASKSKIIFRYGEPILAKPVTGREGVKEFLLYRHPFRYFSSSMIYLYFDHRERLVSWEVIPPA